MPVLFFGLLIGLGALLTGHAAVRLAAVTVPGLRSRPSLLSVWVVVTSALVIKNVLASPLTTWAADQGNLDALGAAFFWARPVPAALWSLVGYALAGAVMSVAVVATLVRLRTFIDDRRQNEPIEWLDLLSLLILMVLWAAAIVTHVLITGNGPVVAAFTVAVTSAMMWLLVIYETRRFIRDIARRAGDAAPPVKPKGVRKFALIFAWLVLCSIINGVFQLTLWAESQAQLLGSAGPIVMMMVLAAMFELANTLIADRADAIQWWGKPQ